MRAMPKTVHLIRHGQSTFNAAFSDPWVDPLHFDAPLTPTGHEQVRAMRAVVADTAYDLVVTSPLTRAIQTALGLFGERHPILVEPLHREYLASSCDVGRSPRALACAFPWLAFDHLDDPWWHDGEKDARGVPLEPMAMFEARLERFRAWLMARDEQVIAVVGHGTFFRHFAGCQLANCERFVMELRGT